MLKKIASTFLILFTLVALWASTSRIAMDYLKDVRNGDKWWCVYQSKGNLLRMSHLDFIKKFAPADEPGRTPARAAGYAKNTALYLYGDSYTWSLHDSDFTSSEYHFINLYLGGKYHLDTTKKNILVIEIAELSIRDHFKDTHMTEALHDTVPLKTSAGFIDIKRNKASYASLGFNLHLDELFNSRINQNLEYNLFNYRFMYSFFLCKAAMNYYVFSRASGDVVISENGDYLLFKEALAYTNKPVPADEMKTLLNDLNIIYDHFKQQGFREVYLSMIPSTTSVVQPKGYNNMIPELQSDPRLRMKIIDAWAALKDGRQDYFCHGDTHWNRNGEQKWLDMVNAILLN